MKKLLMAVMAIAAVALTSCKKESATINFMNEYSKPALVLLSSGSAEPTEETAEYGCFMQPQKAYKLIEKISVKGMKAYFYVATTSEPIDKEGDKEIYEYKRVGSLDLDEYYGKGVITLKVTSNGYYGVTASNF